MAAWLGCCQTLPHSLFSLREDDQAVPGIVLATSPYWSTWPPDSFPLASWLLPPGLLTLSSWPPDSFLLASWLLPPDLLATPNTWQARPPSYSPLLVSLASWPSWKKDSPLLTSLLPTTVVSLAQGRWSLGLFLIETPVALMVKPLIGQRQRMSNKCMHHTMNPFHWVVVWQDLILLIATS